jgi:hypothetical protein
MFAEVSISGHQVRGAVRDRALVVKLAQDLKLNNLSRAVAEYKVCSLQLPPLLGEKSTALETITKSATCLINALISAFWVNRLGKNGTCTTNR